MAAVAAVGLLTVIACRQEGEPERRSYPDDQLLVPPAQIAGMEQYDLRRSADRQRAFQPTGSTVVQRVEDGLVVAWSHDLEELEEGYDGTFFADADGPSLHGVASRLGPGFDFGLEMSWPAGSSAIFLATNDLDERALTQVARDVTLDGDAPELPGELVARVPGSIGTPEPGVWSAYSGSENGGTIAVHAATPTTQAAYEALFLQRPREEPSVRTASSCCAASVYDPPRSVRVDGRDGTIGTVTPYLRVLVVRGALGAVLVSDSGRSGGLTDAQLVEIAESLVPMEPAAFDQLVARRQAEKLDEKLDAAEAEQAAKGYLALTRWEAGERGFAVGYGTAGWLPDEPEMPRLCASDELGNAPTCLPLDAGPSPLSLGPPDALVWGLVDKSVSDVRLDLGDGLVEPLTIESLRMPDGSAIRVVHLLIDLIDTVTSTDLWDSDPDAAMRSITVVALDADGTELARVPLFPHL